MLSNTGINKVILLGQITNKPETDTADKTRDVLRFELVTREIIKKGLDHIEHNEFHAIKVPNKLIEQEGLHLAEGQTVYIEGKIQTSAITDEHRIKRYNLEIAASKVEILMPVAGVI